MKIDEFIKRQKDFLDEYSKHVKESPEYNVEAEFGEWCEFFDFWVETNKYGEFE